MRLHNGGGAYLGARVEGTGQLQRVNSLLTLFFKSEIPGAQNQIARLAQLVHLRLTCLTGPEFLKLTEDKSQIPKA